LLYNNFNGCNKKNKEMATAGTERSKPGAKQGIGLKKTIEAERQGE
jgi:hypothetical protein